MGGGGNKKMERKYNKMMRKKRIINVEMVGACGVGGVVQSGHAQLIGMSSTPLIDYLARRQRAAPSGGSPERRRRRRRRRR